MESKKNNHHHHLHLFQKHHQKQADEKDEHETGKGGETPSLEETSKYREVAQQASIDAIRAAEERVAAAEEKVKMATEDNGGEKSMKEDGWSGSKEDESGRGEWDGAVMGAVWETVTEIVHSTANFSILGKR